MHTIWSRRAARLQTVLVAAYAVALPLSLTGSWVILIIGILVWLLPLALTLITCRRDFINQAKAAMPPLTIPLAIFALCLFLSGLSIGGLDEAFQSLFTLRALIVYFWAYHVFRSESLRRRMTVCVLLSVSALAGLWGAVQQVFDVHPFGYKYLQATGFHGHPMAYAGQMQLFGALAAAMMLANGYRALPSILSRTQAFAPVTILNLLGVLFCAERNAWLGFLSGACAMAARHSWRMLVKVLAVLVVVAALSFSYVPVVKLRVTALTNWQQDVGVRVRLFIWRESIKHWQHAPVFGVGPRRYPRYRIAEAIVPGVSSDLNHAHSNYLHVLTTTGVVGLTAYLYLWLSVLILCLKAVGQSARRGDQFEYALTLGVLGGTVSLMVAGFFEYNFGTAQVRLAHWFVLGMICLPAAGTSAVSQGK